MDLLPAEGAWEKGVFRYPIRVYYEDTDLGGMVYHGRYVSFLERVRSESIRGTVADIDALLGLSEEDGGPTVYVVSELQIKYHQQAFVGDVLIGHSSVTRLRAAAIEVEQWIERKGKPLVSAKLLVAIVDAETGRPKRWPPKVRAAWQQWHDDRKAADENS